MAIQINMKEVEETLLFTLRNRGREYSVDSVSFFKRNNMENLPLSDKGFVEGFNAAIKHITSFAKGV